jgi:hypothetical protein
MKLAIFLLAVMVLGPRTSFAAAPDILSVTIGDRFPANSAFEPSESDNQLPIIQFNVPNSGPTSSIFPEYKVTISRATNTIAIITANRTYEGIAGCNKGLNVAKSWITKHHPQLTFSNDKQDYRSNDSNLFVRVYCVYKEDSPYPTLELQFRGKEQDRVLHEAWRSHFKNPS